MDDQREDYLAERTNWYRESDCSLSDFVTVLNAAGERAPRYAAKSVQGIPVYECRDSGESRMSETLYPVLRDKLKAGNIAELEALSVIGSCAEGYSFPTNLDRDPACQGARAGEPRPDVMLRALREDWEPAEFARAVAKHAWHHGAGESAELIDY